MQPLPALLIGLLAGLFCSFMVFVVKAKFGYDDSLDAFGVHGAGGTLGAILTGIFATVAINPAFGKGVPTGAIDGHWSQIGHQLAGVAISWAISIVGTLVLLFLVDKIIGLRVSAEDEHEASTFPSTAKKATTSMAERASPGAPGSSHLGTGERTLARVPHSSRVLCAKGGKAQPSTSHSHPERPKGVEEPAVAGCPRSLAFGDRGGHPRAARVQQHNFQQRAIVPTASLNPFPTKNTP